MTENARGFVVMLETPEFDRPHILVEHPHERIAGSMRADAVWVIRGTNGVGPARVYRNALDAWKAGIAHVERHVIPQVEEAGDVRVAVMPVERWESREFRSAFLWVHAEDTEAYDPDDHNPVSRDWRWDGCPQEPRW